MLKALLIDNSDDAFRTQLKSIWPSVDIDVVESGAEGLQKAEDKAYQIVMCADNISDYRASEFSAKFRAISRHQYTSLLVLTDKEDTEPMILKQLMMSGVTDVFSKQDISELTNYLVRAEERENVQLSGRVLLLDSTESLLIDAMDMLMDLGLDVDAYTYAEEAWEAFQVGDYDLVIADTMLEGSMSGISLVRKMSRMSGELGDVPIIATSRFEHVSRKVELYHQGVTICLTKPFVLPELRQRVIGCVKAYQTHKELLTQQGSLHSLAMLDELSGLYNRHALREVAGKYFSEAQRLDREITVGFMNIDYFKKINDEYGFEKGNHVIARFGSWLKRRLRDSDIIGRWAADEFVLILPSCDEKAAKALMERLMAQLRLAKISSLNISVSVGLAQLPEDGHHSLEQVIELADKSMYEAKKAGRDQTVAYQDIGN